MMLVGIYGGLASQMNQYAFSLVLKKHYPGVDIKLVNGCQWFPDHTGYELDRLFGITFDGVDKKFAQNLANFHFGTGLTTKFFNAFHRLRDCLIGPKLSQITLKSPGTHEPRIFELYTHKDYLFWGNWPMSLYAEVETELGQKLVFPDNLAGKNAVIAEKMKSENSVSVHVRRGDYIRFGYSLLGEDYYRFAVDEINKRVEDPVYYIFSDDIKTAEKFFANLPHKVIVDWNRGHDSYIDMQLMTCCKHNVIANSGFSIHAAWLNPNTDKIVVSYKKALLGCNNAVVWQCETRFAN